MRETERETEKEREKGTHSEGVIERVQGRGPQKVREMQRESQKKK